MLYLGVSEDDVLSGESRRRAAANMAVGFPLGAPAGGLRGRRPAFCAAPFRAVQSAEVAMVSMERMGRGGGCWQGEEVREWA